MEPARSYLQLTRFHTAPLETVPALLGAMLATDGEINFLVLLWGLFGLLYHCAGYGMNSIVDWMKGYDRLDSNKQHHPLNRGSIKLHRAGLFVGGLLCGSILLRVGLAYSEIPALIFLLLGAIAGVSYNYIGKETQYKFLLISFAHTTVFIVPYLALGGDIFAIEFRLAAVYMFLWVAFQISVSGEIKDMETGESNFLKDLFDVRLIKDHYESFYGEDKVRLYFSTKARLYSITLKSVNLILGLLLFLHLSISLESYIASILWLLVWLAMVVLTLMYTGILTRDGRYYRDARVNAMAMIELLTMFIFIAALYPVIGIEAVVTLMVGSVVWVLMFNQIEWGTWLVPSV